MTNTNSQTASFQYQSAMTRHDWLMLGVLGIVSVVLWAWVWREYQKPIIDPAWINERVAVQPVQETPAPSPDF